MDSLLICPNHLPCNPEPDIDVSIPQPAHMTTSDITSFVQYNRPSLPVLFWRVVFLNTTLQDRQPAKPDLAVPRLVLYQYIIYV